MLNGVFLDRLLDVSTNLQGVFSPDPKNLETVHFVPETKNEVPIYTYLQKSTWVDSQPATRAAIMVDNFSFRFPAEVSLEWTRSGLPWVRYGIARIYSKKRGNQNSRPLPSVFSGHGP